MPLEVHWLHDPEAEQGFVGATLAKGAAALLNVPATWVLAEARAERIPHVRLDGTSDSTPANFTRGG